MGWAIPIERHELTGNLKEEFMDAAVQCPGFHAMSEDIDTPYNI